MYEMANRVRQEGPVSFTDREDGPIDPVVHAIKGEKRVPCAPVFLMDIMADGPRKSGRFRIIFASEPCFVDDTAIN